MKEKEIFFFNVFSSFLILFSLICTDVFAPVIHTERAKTCTVMDSGGQTCFLRLTSLQALGTEALPVDVQPASLILSQGILAGLNTIRHSELPPWLLSIFPLSSYLPTFARLYPEAAFCIVLHSLAII